MIDKELLSILACPKCKSPVRLDGERPPLDRQRPPAGGLVAGWLLCTGSGCGLRFPIRDGIPVMLIEEAEKPS